MYVKMENDKKIYSDGFKFWGCEISKYGRDNGRLDYYTMVKALTYDNYIMNNSIISVLDDFELFNGSDYDDETGEYYDVYQYFIIDEQGANNLAKFTDEIIYYSERADLYLLGVTHWGTSWDYVLTGYEIVNEK